MIAPRRSAPPSTQPVGARGEAERLEQRRARARGRRVGAHAVEAEQRVLGRDVGGAGGERRVGGRQASNTWRRPSGSSKRQGVAVALRIDALVAQARGPEVERRRRADAPLDRVDHAVARAAERGAGELEEREDRAGRPGLVAEVQVVDVGLVEVDRLLHQPQPEQARVEVDVPGASAVIAVTWCRPSSRICRSSWTSVVVCATIRQQSRCRPIPLLPSNTTRLSHGHHRRPPSRDARGRRRRPARRPSARAWRGLLRVHAALTKALDAQLEAEHGLALSSYEVLMYLDDADEQRMRMCDLASR